MTTFAYLPVTAFIPFYKMFTLFRRQYLRWTLIQDFTSSLIIESSTGCLWPLLRLGKSPVCHLVLKQRPSVLIWASCLCDGRWVMEHSQFKGIWQQLVFTPLLALSPCVARHQVKAHLLFFIGYLQYLIVPGVPWSLCTSMYWMAFICKGVYACV